MSMQSFVERVEALLRKVGLANATLVQATPVHKEHFGDTEAIFRSGPLLLHFVRDRGEEFMDVASSTTPEHFHQFDVIALDRGWTTLAESLAATKPDPLEEVLQRLASHMKELSAAFCEAKCNATNDRLDAVAKERGRALQEKIRSKP